MPRRFNFSMEDKNRVDFPDNMYSRSRSKDVPGAVNGAIAAGFAWNARCNLQYLYLYAPTNTTNVFIHLFDISIDEVQNLSGALPDFPPIVLTQAKLFVNIAPAIDSYLSDDRMYLGLGMPFDKGLYIAVSSTENYYTASELPIIWYARLFTGQAGRIPACTEIK